VPGINRRNLAFSAPPEVQRWAALAADLRDLRTELGHHRTELREHRQAQQVDLTELRASVQSVQAALSLQLAREQTTMRRTVHQAATIVAVVIGVLAAVFPLLAMYVQNGVP